MTAESFTVLVVCTGNVNRSALGAALLERWADWYLPSRVRAQVEVTSAGLRAPVGAPMGPRARVIAEALGADGSGHRASQITEHVIRAADLVLVSSTRQRSSVLEFVPGMLRSTFTMREAGRIAATLPSMPAPKTIAELRRRVASLAENRAAPGYGPGGDDIVDPEGKDDEAYRAMTRQQVPPLAQLARVLFGMPQGEVAAYVEAAEAAEFSFGGETRSAAAITAGVGGTPGAASQASQRPRGRRKA
ncbi:arsenate reductase/protein-tyrosine-phosphatase family protein [Agromyces sp. NPDC055520]